MVYGHSQKVLPVYTCIHQSTSLPDDDRPLDCNQPTPQAADTKRQCTQQDVYTLASSLVHS